MSSTLRALAVPFAVVAALVAVAGCGDDTAADGDDTTTSAADDGTLSGYTRTPTPSVAEVTLPLVAGSGDLPVTAEPGGLRVVYFGYTSCPDVCPTTMSDLKQALAELPEDEAGKVDVVMVTIDPDRDVDEKLGAYVTTFIPDGQASRITDPAALQTAADAFGASYRVTPTDDDEPEVSHSADLYVVDDRGDIVLQWPFGTASADIAADLRSLLAEQSAA